MPDWRIYYDDGSVFSSGDGTPEEAPSFGFICAVGYDEAGKRYIMHGWDHYCWDTATSQWWGMDLCGLIDRLTMNRVTAYKMGRTVSRSDFDRLMNAANLDPDFPQVTDGSR